MKKVLVLIFVLIIFINLGACSAKQETSFQDPLQTSAMDRYHTIFDETGQSTVTEGPVEREPYTIGFTILGEDTSFFINVKNSMFAAAKEKGVTLLYAVNNRDPQMMHEITDSFVAQGADMIVDFTVLPEQGSIIAAELKAKGISMLSVDCLYEDAYFFGINNLDAGKTIGRFLATEIDTRWGGEVDAILMLYAEANGDIVKQRVFGAYIGMEESAIYVSENLLTYININTPSSKQTDIGYVKKLVMEYLNDNPNKKNIVIVASTDDMAIGALEAVEMTGRMNDCLMVSHNCDPTAVDNFKKLIIAG